MYPWLAYLGYFSVLGGVILHSLARSWTRSLLGFSIQSFGLGVIAWQISPLPMAITKCVVGWLAATIIAVTLSREGSANTEEQDRPISTLFRASVMLLMFSAVITLLPEFSSVFRNPPPGILAFSGLLIGIGLINIGLSEHPLRVGISLLTCLQGFELGYLWLEQSLLVIGLLAAADLAIVLALTSLYSFSLSPKHGMIQE